jgi:predicted alpha/beta hydrolase
VSTVLTALAILAGLLALAWGWVRFWAWRLRVLPAPDETLWAETDDGWRLPLWRYRPPAHSHATPVILCHGLAATGRNMDLPGRYSLAHTLAARGYDCFVLELRGHGAPRPPRGRAWRRFNFDDYVRRDVPAALAAVRRASGRDRVAWVGHSMGGMVGYALGGSAQGSALLALVAIASPVAWAPWIRRLAPSLRWLPRLLPSRVHLRFYATGFAPFAGRYFPPGDPLRYMRENIDAPLLKRIAASVPGDISPQLLRQCLRWASEDRFDAEDGQADYREGLRTARAPALFIAAALDNLAPPPAVEAAHALWGGEKHFRLFTRGEGASAGYGHIDLVFGRRAPDEVFPEIAAFLDRHAAALQESPRAAINVG